ncbi:MAG: response regulator [Spirochaetales bacterium]|nr:response regulator [Spirochaetales bacterium]
MDWKNILIVDDSKTARMIIKRCLEIAGYTNIVFFEAEDGISALEFLKENTVDIIFTDLKMPKMDGKTFVLKLKCNEYTKQIPVIVITSMGNTFIDEQLITSGAHTVIQKPLSPLKMREALGEI